MFKKYTKGIILAGGHGTRLYPLTKSMSKQLLPVNDKPMIYYPISLAMISGIKELLIITSPEFKQDYKNLLLNGNQWGIDIEYVTQNNPNGIAEALIMGEKFIGNNNIALFLGDNLFFGNDIFDMVRKDFDLSHNAVLYACAVKNPNRYGVIEFNDKNEVISIEEKPQNPKSNYAVTGLYFYDNDAIDFAKELRPSKRGELEITDINLRYIKEKDKKVIVRKISEASSWFDAGTPDSLLQAGNFFNAIEKRTGSKTHCPEEIAFQKGYINKQKFENLINKIDDSPYSQYLNTIL